MAGRCHIGRGGHDGRHGNLRINLLSPRRVHRSERILGTSNIGHKLANRHNQTSHTLSPVISSETPPENCTSEYAYDMLEGRIGVRPNLPKKFDLPPNTTMDEHAYTQSLKAAISYKKSGDHGAAKKFSAAAVKYKELLSIPVKKRHRNDEKERSKEERRAAAKAAEDAWNTELIQRWKPAPPPHTGDTPVSTPKAATAPSTPAPEIEKQPSAEDFRHMSAEDCESQSMLSLFVEGAAARDITLERLFNEIDVDGSGSLTWRELQLAFQRLGIERSKKDTIQLVDWLDEDKSGTVEMDELMAKVNPPGGRKRARHKMACKAAQHVAPGSVMDAWLISKDAAKDARGPYKQMHRHKTPGTTAIWLGSPAGRRFDPREDQVDVEGYKKMGEDLGGEMRIKILKIVELDGRAIEMDNQKRQRDMVAALSESLGLRVQVFGAKHADCQNAARRLTLGCNAMAMEYLEDHQDATTCLELLKKADVLARKFTKMDQIQGLLATTCNNYACYWRRMSTRSGIKMKQRLSCLNNVRRCIEQAVLLEAMSGQAINGPGTLINFGTILSELGRHPEALSKAQEAALQLESLPDRGKFTGLVLQGGVMATSQLAVAYHNAGVSHTALGHAAEALEASKNAIEAAREQAGSQHLITARVENGLIDALTVQRALPWAERGDADPELWELVTTADRSLGSGKLRPIGITAQGPVAWNEKALTKEKNRFSVFPGLKDFATQGRYLENTLRPHSSLDVGPPSLTIHSGYEGKAMLGDCDIWELRQKDAWRFSPTFMQSKGLEKEGFVPAGHTPFPTNHWVPIKKYRNE